MMTTPRLRAIAIAAAAFLSVAGGTAKAELLTFDSVTTATAVAIPNGYGNVNWSNMYVVNPTLLGASPSGYYNGVVSPSYVAYNFGGAPASLSAPSGTFTLTSGYFTAAWNDGLQVEVQGYSGANLVDDVTFTVNTSGPTLETLNFQNITSATFLSSGGTNHGYNGSGTQFVLDNLTLTTPISGVPAPASIVLTTFGGLTMTVVRRLRRRSPERVAPIL